MSEERIENGQVVHVYDGIVEHDNHLPRWWLYTLYGACIFAVGYWIYYQAYGVGASPLEAYQRERVAARKAEVAKVMAMGELTDDKLIEMSKNPAVVSAGAKVYASVCVACHAANGAGQIGPNLTDDYWLHGSAPTAILKTVREGVVDKGMLAWGPQLGEEKVRAVSAYLLTIVGTNVAGKEPQGEKIVRAPGGT